VRATIPQSGSTGMLTRSSRQHFVSKFPVANGILAFIGGRLQRMKCVNGSQLGSDDCVHRNVVSYGNTSPVKRILPIRNGVSFKVFITVQTHSH
jgi:hypothetical protein